MPEEKSIDLNPEQQQILVNQLKDINLALSTLHHSAQTGSVPFETADIALRFIENNLYGLCKKFGVEINGSKEKEERNEKLRNANLRVRELERQLGERQSVAQLKPSLGLLNDKLRVWWGTHGFGHITSVSFHQYGVELDLCCMLFGRNQGLLDDGSVSKKEALRQWHQDLEKQGIVLVTPEGERTPVVVDCEQSRNTIRQWLSALPSATVLSFGNRGGPKSDLMTLSNVTVHVSNYEDIHSLPAKEPAND